MFLSCFLIFDSVDTHRLAFSLPIEKVHMNKFFGSRLLFLMMLGVSTTSYGLVKP